MKIVALVALPAFLLSACEHDGQREASCSSTYGRSGSNLRRGGEPGDPPGGWDANGQALFGLTIGAPPLTGVTFDEVMLNDRALVIDDANANGLVARAESGELFTGSALVGAKLSTRAIDGTLHKVEITAAEDRKSVV